MSLNKCRKCAMPILIHTNLVWLSQKPRALDCQVGNSIMTRPQCTSHGFITRVHRDSFAKIESMPVPVLHNMS